MARFCVLDPAEVSSERLKTCETTVRKLTESLGCTEPWADQVLVEPANVTASHTCDGMK